MHARRSGIHPLSLALVGALMLFVTPGVRADEETSALDASYKQSGRLAQALALQYESALRQTLVRLGEVSRQNPADLARSPLALETARAQWPIATYLIEDDKVTVAPAGRSPLTLTDLRELEGRKSKVFLREGLVIVAVAASGDRVTTAEIPLGAFTAPLEGIALKGGSLSLLDDQGRPLGQNALTADDQELVRSLPGDTTTTFVSKTSLLSLARIQTAGWTVVAQVPLTEAYRGIAVPELDERTMPYPLYLVKRAEKAPMEGIGRGIMLSAGGVIVLFLGLAVVRRRLKAPSKRPAGAEPFGGSRPAVQEGEPSVLESLVSEKRIERSAEPQPSTPMPPLLQAPPEAATGVWQDTMQAQITFLHDELRKTQDQLRNLAQMPRLGALEKRLEAELESLSGAMRQRLDFEGKRLSTLEAASAERFAAIDENASRLAAAVEARWSEASEMATEIASRLSTLSESLQIRFEQEDRLLASLDQELSQVRSELEALWAQHRGLGELHEGKIALLERELENYRNQGAQASRQANERIEILAKGLHELHGALETSQQERSEVRVELEALSERVHRVVKLIAKARPA
jgi:hypothetical protein